MKLSGTGIGVNAKVASITNGTTFVATVASSATGAGLTLTALRDAVVYVPPTGTNPLYYDADGNTLNQTALNLLALNVRVYVTYDITLVADTDYTIDLELGVVSRKLSSPKVLPNSTLNFTVSRVNDDVTYNTLQSLVIGDANANTGIYALTVANSLVHVAPKILVAPYFTDRKPDANTRSPVVSALEIVTVRMNAVAYCDCSDTNEVDAVSHKDDFGTSDRLIFLYPWFKVLAPGSTGEYINRPMSAYFAGLTSRTDNDHGFFYSPSNFPIYGIQGLSRTVSFYPSDPNTQANYLNENNVSTVVYIDELVAWGNRTASGRFISVRRTADMIHEAIIYFSTKFSDRPMLKGLFQDILDAVNIYLGEMKRIGAIVDGKAWLSKADNTNATLAQGKGLIDFSFSVPGPLERLTFRSHLTSGFLEEVVQDFNA